MKAQVVWQSGQVYSASNEHGNTVPFDASGTHSAGASPMEAVLMALCGCTSVDVIEILRKKRQPFTGLTVSAEAEQATEPPRIFTNITLTYTVAGNVDRKAMEDAVHLSKEKYCSVSAMLSKSAQIHFVIVYRAEESA